MLSIGILLLVIGIVLVVLTAVTAIPAPLAQLGWVALVIGIVLIVADYLLPALHTGTAALLLTSP